MSTTGFICAFPPSEVFVKYDYTRILQLLGINCDKRPVTTIQVCPKCRKNTLLISPLESTSAWLNCQNCGLNGDPLRIYQIIYKIQEANDIFSALSIDLPDQADLNEDLRIGYLQFHSHYYGRIEKLWKSAQEATKDCLASSFLRRLASIDLWLDQKRFNRSLKNLVGITNKFTVFQYLGIDLHALRGKHMANVLVFPYMLRPGLISGFGFIGRHDVLRYANLIPGQDGGFYGLDPIPADRTADVYVLDNPIQVARIHLKAAVEGLPPLPVVAKGITENPAWDAIIGKPVFWVDEPTPEVLKQALRLNNSKVIVASTPPVWSNKEQPPGEWGECFLPSIKQRITLSERLAPLHVAANLLLKNSSFIACEYVREMCLTQHHKTLMLNLPLSQDNKTKLETILDNTAPAGTVRIGKKQVIESEGNWCIKGSRNSPDELISEVILRVKIVQKREEDSATLLYGELIFDGNIIPIRGVEESNFRRSARKTIEYICSKVGINSYPFMTDFGAKNFLDIAFQLRPPKIEFTQSYVGFDYNTGRFKLPRMSITHENIFQEEGQVAILPNTPCLNLATNAPVTVAHLKKWFKLTYETASYWAAFAGLIQIVWNKVSKSTKTGLLLVGTEGSMAEHLYYLLKSDLQLIGGTLNKVEPQNKTLYETAKRHHVPVTIDGLRSDKNALKQWLSTGNPNSIVLIDSLTASAMGTAKDWIVVRSERKFSGNAPDLLNTEIIFPNFLKHILDYDPQNVKAVLERLNMWISHYSITGSKVLEESGMLLSTQGLINTRSDAFHLIFLLMKGVQKGIFFLRHGDSPQKASTILVNDVTDTVYVDMSALHRQLKSSNLPAYDWDEAIYELESNKDINRIGDTNSIIKMPRPVWNALIIKAKRLARMHSKLGNG